MKFLTLLRHAKSDWSDAVTRDFDRPLNARGQRAATLIGRYLREEGLAFDHVVASPAVRVTETLASLADGYRAPLAPVWDRRLYLASAEALLEVVHDLPEGANRVLMVGHNPGLEDLVLSLVPASGTDGRAAVAAKYPTASLAELVLDIPRWPAAAAGGARLARFVRPRDLDPTLGPED